MSKTETRTKLRIIIGTAQEHEQFRKEYLPHNEVLTRIKEFRQGGTLKRVEDFGDTHRIWLFFPPDTPYNRLQGYDYQAIEEIRVLSKFSLIRMMSGE